MSLNVTKTGLFKKSNINEYHVEPDGSMWEHVCHHNNPAVNLFASTDDFTNGVYKNKDLWFNFQICNQLTSNWEFLIFQNKLISDKPLKYRWVQTVNPFTAVFADVAAANITKVTSTGYTDFSHGGLYKKNSNSFFTTNDGTASDWFGAIGCWKNHQGGIPAWNIIVPTTGCVDVFVRVDSIDKIAKFYKTNLQVCNNFYEY